jgi:hypothetical protein
LGSKNRNSARFFVARNVATRFVAKTVGSIGHSIGRQSVSILAHRQRPVIGQNNPARAHLDRESLKFKNELGKIAGRFFKFLNDEM